MGTNGRDDDTPRGEIERDEPLAELRELRVETSENFTGRLKRRIERMEVTNHFLWIIWHLPARVLLEFFEVFFGVFKSNRNDGGGVP